jgi:hypothetical protein
MKFMMTYNIYNESWDKAVSRFLETGGLPPEGLKLVGRWHSAAGRNGFLLLEGDDVSAIYHYAAQWHDFCDLVVTPVLEDEAAAAVLASTRR